MHRQQSEGKWVLDPLSPLPCPAALPCCAEDSSVVLAYSYYVNAAFSCRAPLTKGCHQDLFHNHHQISTCRYSGPRSKACRSSNVGCCLFGNYLIHHLFITGSCPVSVGRFHVPPLRSWGSRSRSRYLIGPNLHTKLHIHKSRRPCAARVCLCEALACAPFRDTEAHALPCLPKHALKVSAVPAGSRSR